MKTTEMELFTLDYQQPPAAVWQALRRATLTMDQGSVNDAAMIVQFSTGISWTSWGEHMLAQVFPDGTGARVVVRGRPKGSFMTTGIGEKVHASGIRKELEKAINDAL